MVKHRRVWRHGGIGRHEGLKIPWAVMPVRVQVPVALLRNLDFCKLLVITGSPTYNYV